MNSTPSASTAESVELSSEADTELPDGKVNRLGERLSFFIFWAIHVGCLAALWTGVSVRSVALCVGLYWLRMFGITGGYHRYFAHRAYKTSRWFQFVHALLGTASVQKGPLWWASTHRKHHRFSDTPEDVHSPRQKGFWYSHVRWITSGDHIDTDMKEIKDFARFPELVWLGRWHFLPPLVLAIVCGLVDGWRGVVVGMGWSTVLVWHFTFTINSLSHVIGTARYRTGDDSKNHWLLAFFSMGEGWHNNHHFFQSSANQGFLWWEYDFSYWILCGLEKLGIVWDLRRAPAHVIARTIAAEQAQGEGPAVANEVAAPASSLQGAA